MLHTLLVRKYERAFKKTYSDFPVYWHFHAGHAQFYNGHQMSFGKNRVQYNEFVWSFYRYAKYDVYFNEDGKNLAEYTADYAEQIIPQIEAFFDYTMEKEFFLWYTTGSLITGKAISDWLPERMNIISVAPPALIAIRHSCILKGL